MAEEAGNQAPEAASDPLVDRIARLRSENQAESLAARAKAVSQRSTRREQAREFVAEREAPRRAFRQGMLFGFADEIEAASRAIWDRAPGEDYVDAYVRLRDRVRGEMEEFRESRPVLGLGLELAGGLTLPGVGTGGAIATGTTTAARIGRGAAAGGGTGALFGAGVAEEVEDIPGEAAVGATIGAFTGAALPAALQGGRAVVSGVRSALSPQTGAQRRIGQAITRDEMTPEQITEALEEAQRLGRPATPADVGGEALRRELEVAAQTPGAAGQIAERVLGARNREQLSRLSNDLVRGTGVNANAVEDVIEKTMRVRAKAAAPVYERAMDFPAELNDDIVEAWTAANKTPIGKDALTLAKKILNVENFDEAPLMERIDAFKRGLDDVIEQATRRGQNAVARKATEMKSNLVELVDAVNPNYKKARRIWESGSQYLDAIDRGRDVLKPSFTAAKMRQEFSAMTDAEQEAFRIGVVDSIVTRLRQQSAQEPNLIKLLRSPEMRDKLKAVMKPERAAELDKILDMEDAMFRTASQARRGSPTAQRLASQAEQAKQLSALRGVDFILEMALTPLRGLFLRALPAVPRATRERLLARQNAIITQRLLSSDPDELLSIPSRALTAPRHIEGAATPLPIIGAQESMP